VGVQKWWEEFCSQFLVMNLENFIENFINFENLSVAKIMGKSYFGSS
jgi:hypothetical protein